MRLEYLVSARPLLPPDEPLRTVVERWACWGWPVTKATGDQPRPQAARSRLIKWLNSPAVFAAYHRASGRLTPWDFELLPCIAERFRFVEWGSPPPPRVMAKPQAREPAPSPSLQRNEEIYRLRYSGMLLSEIGDRFGLGKERVRQIVLQMERRHRRQNRERARLAALDRSAWSHVWTPEMQWAIEGEWPRPEFRP